MRSEKEFDGKEIESECCDEREGERGGGNWKVKEQRLSHGGVREAHNFGLRVLKSFYCSLLFISNSHFYKVRDSPYPFPNHSLSSLL